MAVDFDILDLKIGNRGLEMGIPVHQSLAAIDQALFVHIDEDLDHRIVEVAALVALGRTGRAGHGEGVALPVAGTAQPLELVDDGVTVLALPLPDLFEELLAPQFAAARIALGGEHFLDL